MSVLKTDDCGILITIWAVKYSVVSIEWTEGNKRTGRVAFFFHLLHEKQVQGEQKKYYMRKCKQGGQKLQND